MLKKRKDKSDADSVSENSSPDDKIEKRLKRFEELFEQIASFTDAIAHANDELSDAVAAEAKAKEAYEAARDIRKAIEESRDGAKSALVRFVTPRNGEIMPLFDTMEEADEAVHGKNSTEWRKEPLASLRLSVPAFNALTEADVVLVGQLQDRVLTGKSWFEEIPGISVGMASAIQDRLNDFIFERTK